MDISLILLAIAVLPVWLLRKKYQAIKNSQSQAALRLTELLRAAEQSKRGYESVFIRIQNDLQSLQARADEMEQRLHGVALSPNQTPSDACTATSVLPVDEREQASAAVTSKTTLSAGKSLRRRRKAAAPLAAEPPARSRRGSSKKKDPAPRRKVKLRPVLLTDIVDDIAAYAVKRNSELSRANGAAA